MKVAILAITRNGKEIGRRLLAAFPEMTLYAPAKLRDDAGDIVWYDGSTTLMAGRLFAEYDGVVYLFSLGAVIRLISPHMRDKKSDPAVLVIDDKMNFVISVLSGHLGGANRLASEIAGRTGATPVITTAADVNKTISVDLIGRDLGWRIDDDANVTRISAHMVNSESIGVFQDAGSREWQPAKLPENVTIHDTIEGLAGSGCRGFLVITDRIIPEDVAANAVVYRPPSLVVGVGVHQTTTTDTILNGIRDSLSRHKLSAKSISMIASLRRPIPVDGLKEAAARLNVPLKLIERQRLAEVQAPNPSEVVRRFEGTPSVSEAAALLASGGAILVQKQKFPPDLTVAVARVP